MPYASTAELPSAVRSRYSDTCARAFLHAFNGAYAEHGESRAFAIGHAAAQRCQQAQKGVMDKSNVADATTPRSPSFRIFSAELTPFEAKDGKRRLRTIASSTVEDLGGDVITAAALKKMAESAKGMTIFRNHSYKVPDDILGSVEKAKVEHSGTDDVGKPIFDLMLDVLVREDPKSVETYEAIESGVKLGTSIGAMIPIGGVRKGDNGGNIFDDLRLMEASIVGIPQNPRSWVQYATKAWKVFQKDEDDEEEPNSGFLSGNEESAEPEAEAPESSDESEVAEKTVEKGTAWMETTPDGGVKVTVQADTIPPEKDQPEKAAKPEVVKDHEHGDLDGRDWANLPAGDQDEADAFYADLDAAGQLDSAVNLAADPDLLKAVLSSEARSNLKPSDFACPAKKKYPIHDKAHIRNALARCGDSSNDQCGCDRVRSAAHKAGIGEDKAIEPDLTADAEPDITASVDAAASGDEETPAQELAKSVPESADDDLLNDTLTKSAEVMADLVKSLSRENGTLRRAVTDAEASRDEAIQKAADAKANADYAISIALQLATTPFGRKAVNAEAVADLQSRFGGVYSADVLKMLENKE